MGKKKKIDKTAALIQKEEPAVEEETNKPKTSNDALPNSKSTELTVPREGVTNEESSNELKEIQALKSDDPIASAVQEPDTDTMKKMQSKQDVDMINIEPGQKDTEAEGETKVKNSKKEEKKSKGKGKGSSTGQVASEAEPATDVSEELQENKKSKKKSKTTTKDEKKKSELGVQPVKSDDQNVKEESETAPGGKHTKKQKLKKVKTADNWETPAQSDRDLKEDSATENAQKQTSKTKTPKKVRTADDLATTDQSDKPDTDGQGERIASKKNVSYSVEDVEKSTKKTTPKKKKETKKAKEKSAEEKKSDDKKINKQKATKNKHDKAGRGDEVTRESPGAEESDLKVIVTKEIASVSKLKSEVAFEVKERTSSGTMSASARTASRKKFEKKAGGKRSFDASKTHYKVVKSKSDMSYEEDFSYGSSDSEVEIGGDTSKRKKKKKEKKTKSKKKSVSEPVSPSPTESVGPQIDATPALEGIPTEVEGVDKPRGKEKAKKEGKKHAKKVRMAEASPEEEQKDDILAEITKLKTLAAGAEVEEPVKEEEKTVKKVKKPPKKKSKKERARLTAEMSEKMRQEQEQEAARQAEMERIRLEEERKAAIEKDKREVVEQQVRVEQLERSDAEMQKIVDFNVEIMKREMEEMEWQLYLACGKLPNPSLCDQMNTYLHLWEKVLDSTSIEEASKRTADVIKLLSDIEDLLDTSAPPTTPEEARKIENLKWVRQLFRDHQAESLDVATYRLLRCVEKNLRRIDIPTADFNFANDQIKLSIWLRVQLPIPLPNPRRPPKPRLDVTFENVSMQVLFPVVIDGENMAIRAMYLSYDHLSDLCPLYYMPDIEEPLDEDLLVATRKDWRVRMLYKYRNRDRPKPVVAEQSSEPVSSPDTVASEKKEEPEEEDFASDEEIPVVPFKKLQPTASEFVAIQEEQTHQQIKQKLLTNLDESIINLRKYTILGGVYHLDLLYQPPQPQDFITMNMNITALYLPKQLERVPFSVIYTPPKPPEQGVRRLPEEIEEEMKKQEEEMDKLALITLTWPQHVIFLELPIVCQWDEENRYWTRRNIHDLKHNEEKGMLTFRTGVFGVFALSTLKYSNLPYQAWELKPEADGTITLQITAAILMLEFNVKEGLICISQLQNSPNNALQNMVGVYQKLYKLQRIMKEAGVDVFPEKDAFSYLEGSCEKHWPTEKHLYLDMARMCSSFNFAWSRWNITSGRRNIVLQMREYFPNKPKQKNHSMLLVTPLKASLVDCTEVSQVFSGESIDNIKFSSDLYNLMKVTSGIAVRKNLQSVSKEIVYVLAQLLISTRVLSFS